MTEEIIETRREQLQKLTKIASSLDIPLCQLALAWVLRLPEISSTIMGASKPEQVAVNTGASDVTLDNDVVDLIFYTKTSVFFK